MKHRLRPSWKVFHAREGRLLPFTTVNFSIIACMAAGDPALAAASLPATPPVGSRIGDQPVHSPGAGLRELAARSVSDFC